MSPFSAVDCPGPGPGRRGRCGRRSCCTLHLQQESLVPVYPILWDDGRPFEVLVDNKGMPGGDATQDRGVSR